MFGSLLQLAIPFHVLSPLALQQPTALLQGVVLVWVLLALYATLKFRHGGAVWRALGWALPSRRYLLAAPLGGILWAGVVILVVRSTSTTSTPHYSLEALGSGCHSWPRCGRIFFPWLPASTDCADLGVSGRCHPYRDRLCHLPPAPDTPPLCLLRGEWYSLWLGARRLRFHHSRRAHAFRLQPDPIRVPKDVTHGLVSRKEAFRYWEQMGGQGRARLFMRGHPGRSAFSARLRESRRSIPWVKITAV